MPQILCEFRCGYEGIGETAQERFDDVLAHEKKMHCRPEDKQIIFEQEMDRREENRKLARPSRR